VDHLLVHRVLEPRQEQARMSLHIKEQKAHEEASRLELEQQRRRRNLVAIRVVTSTSDMASDAPSLSLWEVYEHYPISVRDRDV
jgi:hypothetical protein